MSWFYYCQKGSAIKRYMGINKARVTGNMEVQTVPNNLNMVHKSEWNHFSLNSSIKYFDHSPFENLNDIKHMK